jgi:hypothetical protein
MNEQIQPPAGTQLFIARDLSAEERSVRRHLDPAINQGDFIAAAIGTGRYSVWGVCAGRLCQWNSGGGPAGLRIDCVRP